MIAFSIIITCVISLIFTAFSFHFILNSVVPYNAQHIFEKKYAKSLLFIFVFSLVSLAFYTYNFGYTTKIGSLFERQSYTAKYYVDMYEYETEAFVGTYPADISCEHEEARLYRIENVYTPSKKIECSSDAATGNDIYNGRFITVNDSSIGPFYVVITDERYIPDVDSQQVKKGIGKDDLDYHSLLRPVDSTCFSEVGYDSSNEILVVEFLDSGSIYAYYDVPKSEYKDLVGADSIGGYYNSSVKGQYKSQRLE